MTIGQDLKPASVVAVKAAQCLLEQAGVPKQLLVFSDGSGFGTDTKVFIPVVGESVTFYERRGSESVEVNIELSSDCPAIFLKRRGPKGAVGDLIVDATPTVVREQAKRLVDFCKKHAVVVERNSVSGWEIDPTATASITWVGCRHPI